MVGFCWSKLLIICWSKLFYYGQLLIQKVMNQGQFRKHIFLNCVGPTVRDSGGIWKNNFWILVSLLLLLLKISFCFPSFNCCEISASSLLYGEFSSFNFQPFCPSTSVILVIFLLSWDNWMYVFSFQEGKKKKNWAYPSLECPKRLCFYVQWLQIQC